MRSRGPRAQRDAESAGRGPACRQTPRRPRAPRRAARADRRPTPSSARRRLLRLGEGREMTQSAILLCGHGSRDPEAIAEFEQAAGALRVRLPEVDFATGYLEFARPTIRDGLALLAARGARRIFAIPGMLFAASHVKNDLPWETNSFIAENPGIDVRLGRDLGIDPKPLQAAADRIAAATADGKVPRAETLLVVVGR